MPINKGRKPRYELVDIKLRNGLVVRNVEPDKWRWKPWPDGESAGDIVIWQPAGLLKRWDGKNSASVKKGFTQQQSGFKDSSSIGRAARQQEK